MRIARTLLPLLVSLPALLRPQAAPVAVQQIAYARDGRLVASADGDLWLRAADGPGWRQLTRGTAWDRFPAFAHDGKSIVFSSDRDGVDHLYRLTVSGSGAPERLTNSTLPDGEPSMSADGTVYFVRGRGPESRLWKRSATGEEQRVTTGTLPERTPSLSPLGNKIAYIQSHETGRRVRIKELGGKASDSVLIADRAAESLAWDPAGTRIALTVNTPRPGLFVAAADGRYVNYIAALRGVVAWDPRGRELTVATRDLDEPGYNGDPQRVVDRQVGEALGAGAQALVTIAAPVLPPEPRRVAAVPSGDRTMRNQEAFARFASRIERVYFSGDTLATARAAWRAAIAALEPNATRAQSDSALDDVMQQALERRPTLRPPARGRAAVSSAHPVATTAGLDVLAKGGNVVDAAVAVSFALGVVEPDANGVGGYGEMLVFTKGMERPHLIEFMARVPEEGTLANAALQPDGRYPTDGPILPMVPGTVAGMHAAFKRFGSGKVTWAEVLAPAIKAAKEGYAVSDGLATTLRVERDRFAKYESSRALFFKDGTPLNVGDTIRNPDLAWTLEQIAKGGADGFYRGEVARRLVNDLRGKGNAIRLTDLARYFAAEREPVSTTYRGYTVFGSAPPASGGALLAAQLNALENHATPKPYTRDAATLHAMISAWQLAPTTRNRIADPSLWPTDVSPFTSKDTARMRWSCYSPSRAVTPQLFRGDTLTCPAAAPAANSSPDRPSEPFASEGEGCAPQEHAAGAICRAQGTTSFAVADADGNAVAVTQTLGTWGGNFYVSPGLGFLYNDKLLSYGTDANAYGARLPYARHGSSISPTLVFRDEGGAKRAVLALGAAGNAWINAAVYQTLVGVLDLGLTPQRALELPRFLPGQRTNGAGIREFVIDIENGIAPGVLAQLRALGHRFNVISLKGELRMGYGSAIAIGGGVAEAGADPRRSGTAGAIP